MKSHGAALVLLLAAACSSSEREGSSNAQSSEKAATRSAREQPAPAKSVTWEGLSALLPHPEVRGWRAAAEGPRIYGADELYTYMDGQCDSYLEYGVRKLAVLDYHPVTGGPSRTVQIELYDMGTPAGAFGRWSRLAVEGGDPAEMAARFIEVGAGGIASGTDLAFWKGQHLGKLTFLDESPDATEESLRAAAREVLLPIARVLVERLPGDASPLPEVGRLPTAGLLAHSHVRYGRATLGLEALAGGLCAEYAVDGKRMRLFVIERPTAEELQPGLDALRARLTGTAVVAGLGETAERGTDPDRGDLLVARKGARLVVVANSDTPDAPEASAAQKRALAESAL